MVGMQIYDWLTDIPILIKISKNSPLNIKFKQVILYFKE